MEELLKKTPERDKEMENIEEKIRDLEKTRRVKTYIKTSVTKVITKYIHSKNSRDRRKLHQACTLRIKVNKI